MLDDDAAWPVAVRADCAAPRMDLTWSLPELTSPLTLSMMELILAWTPLPVCEPCTSPEILPNAELMMFPSSLPLALLLPLLDEDVSVDLEADELAVAEAEVEATVLEPEPELSPVLSARDPPLDPWMVLRLPRMLMTSSETSADTPATARAAAATTCLVETMVDALYNKFYCERDRPCYIYIHLVRVAKKKIAPIAWVFDLVREQAQAAARLIYIYTRGGGLIAPHDSAHAQGTAQRHMPLLRHDPI